MQLAHFLVRVCVVRGRCLLSSSSASPVLNITCQKPEIDTLDLWHRLLADISDWVIRKALRNKLFEEVVLVKNT